MKANEGVCVCVREKQKKGLKGSVQQQMMAGHFVLKAVQEGSRSPSVSRPATGTAHASPNKGIYIAAAHFRVRPDK